MRRILGTLFVLLVASAAASPQNAGAPTVARTTGDREYKVGPADVLTITIVDVPQLSRTVTVSNSGKVHLPHLGVLQIASMTCREVEEHISRILRERQLVKDPGVLVRVEAYRSNTVYVVGEVMMGGQYVIRDEMYVLDLLTLGMGFGGEWVSPIVYLYRRPVAEPSGDGGNDAGLVEAIPINVAELYSGKKPELNVKLRGGDMLYCPERQREYFYILGDVGRPGMLELDSKEELPVSRAISMAGGPLRTARLGKGMLVRMGEAGEREEIPIDFQAVLRGKKTDFAVKPNDVIYIPGSTLKALAYGLLGVVPGIAETAVVF